MADTKSYKTAAFWIVFILVFALAPLRMTSNYQLVLANHILIWGMFAVAFNMLFGVAGMLSFGQALYYGLGAYGVGLSVKHLGASWFLPGIGMGLIGSVVLSVLVGLLIIRVSGVFFTVLTLAFGQLVWQVTFRWYSPGETTGYRGSFLPVSWAIALFTTTSHCAWFCSQYGSSGGWFTHRWGSPCDAYVKTLTGCASWGVA